MDRGLNHFLLKTETAIVSKTDVENLGKVLLVSRQFKFKLIFIKQRKACFFFGFHWEFKESKIKITIMIP